MVTSTMWQCEHVQAKSGQHLLFISHGAAVIMLLLASLIKHGAEGT